jgi:hypothetical protein
MFGPVGCQNSAGHSQCIRLLAKEHTGGSDSHYRSAVQNHSARRRADSLRQAEDLSGHFLAVQFRVVHILKDTSGDGEAEAVYEFVDDDRELSAISDVFSQMLDDIALV